MSVESRVEGKSLLNKSLFFQCLKKLYFSKFKIKYCFCKITNCDLIYSVNCKDNKYMENKIKKNYVYCTQPSFEINQLQP